MILGALERPPWSAHHVEDKVSVNLRALQARHLKCSTHGLKPHTMCVPYSDGQAVSRTALLPNKANIPSVTAIPVTVRNGPAFAHTSLSVLLMRSGLSWERAGIARLSEIPCRVGYAGVSSTVADSTSKTARLRSVFSSRGGWVGLLQRDREIANV